MPLVTQKQLRAAFKGTTLLRSRDLSAQGFDRASLRQAVQDGLLERAGRGLYRSPEADITEHHTLAEVAKRVPNGVICLLSALRFHQLTSQSPHEVWITIHHKAWRPQLDHVGLRVVRASDPALREGVEAHMIEGVPVQIYNPAKTVADCFKFRHKIGLDVALEALREVWRARRATMNDLEHYARVDRVARVMNPYLASLT
jgi:predicted transcriptional regulator of viral defense system